MSSLRERKRARTRQALIDAAVELFERHGYDKTTIADITTAADISPRTFFLYFASKEDLVFADGDARLQTTLKAIEQHAPEERPVEILLRALRESADSGDDMVGEMAQLRLRLIRTVPALRGRALQIQQDGQAEIAQRLHVAFPDELDDVEAAALAGAFIGAITGALQVLLRDDDPDPNMVQRRLQEVAATALQPWA
ncbi:MAG TPA: TetR family transcriptional regulator [Mycobacterium sp.]|nr:TetR family transcriptional regulator [Mycobacterium sp.]